MSSLLQDLVKSYVAQISSAMIISEILRDHSTETEITPDLLITGLVYRLMTPMTNEEIHDNLESASDVIDDVFENPYPDDEESDDEDSEEVVLERTPRKIKTNTCNCNICSQARVCLLNYYTHECTDPLAQKFKDSITHTCQTHNLVI